MPDETDTVATETQDWPVVAISAHRTSTAVRLDVVFYGRGGTWRTLVDVPRGHSPNLLPAARRELAAQVRAAGEAGDA